MFIVMFYIFYYFVAFINDISCIFVSIFNKNPQLLSMTSWSIKIYFAGAFMFGIQIACQQTFLALGKATISLVLALLRKIVLLIPLIFILPTFFNEKLCSNFSRASCGYNSRYYNSNFFLYIL